MPDSSPLRALVDKARATGNAVDFLLQEVGASLLHQPRLPANLDEILQWLKAVFAGCDDIVIREFTVGRGQPVRAAVAFIDGLVNHQTLHEHVLTYLTTTMSGNSAPTGGIDLIGEVRRRIPVGEIREVERPANLVDAVLHGDAALLLDGEATAFLVNLPGWDKRNIDKPEHKAVVKGPKDAFTETLRVNTALIRRRLRDPGIKVESLRIGRVSRTDVAIIYHQRLADPRLVAEVRRRIEAVDVDGVLDSGMIEWLIGDHPLSIFPLIQDSERPDEVSAAILEGRVAILVDNTPFALLAPATVNSLMMTPEDHYFNWMVATFFRSVRFIASLVALTLPALYVALTSFSPELIPLELGIFVAGSREGRPFAVMTEVLLMETTMEILREATIRLPGAFGQTLSVVGALVVGQAAVRAGLVSAVVIIITGTTAVASFSIPSMVLGAAVRLLRFPLILLTGLFGLPGLVVGLYIIFVHAASLRSFGLEYLAPFGPLYRRDLKDTILRLPAASRRRAWEYHPRDARRTPYGSGG